jgi:hypothetical protein
VWCDELAGPVGLHRPAGEPDEPGHDDERQGDELQCEVRERHRQRDQYQGEQQDRYGVLDDVRVAVPIGPVPGAPSHTFAQRHPTTPGVPPPPLRTRRIDDGNPSMTGTPSDGPTHVAVEGSRPPDDEDRGP